MQIELIVACDRSGAIGSAGGGIPWNLPRDRAHFRRQASGSGLLLGRKTFEEMADWFTNQQPIVLTGNPEFQPDPPARVVPDLATGLSAARALGLPRLLVGGGAAVFEAAMPLADRLIVTHVDLDLATHSSPSDSDDRPDSELPRFPAINPQSWRLTRCDRHPADRDHEWPLEFCWYQRRHGTE